MTCMYSQFVLMKAVEKKDNTKKNSYLSNLETVLNFIKFNTVSYPNQ